MNYACHAVTLSNNKIGGDWPGFAASAIEGTFPGAVGLVAIGCGADQNPTSGVTGDKVDVARAQGREVAAEVKRLSENFLAPVTGKLVAKVETLSLPMAEHPTKEQWEEKAKRMDAIGHHARVTLAKLARGEKLPTEVAYPVQTWAFGDSLAMVHLPGEVVVDYALRLKKELDGRRLWVTAYANNAPCYIPSERILKEGGYEGGGAMIYYDLPTQFKPGLEETIVAAVKGQIGKTFAAKFDANKTNGSRPKSPQQSLAEIRVAPSLRVELVAAEPLVSDPVAIAFGPDGRLWVCEMADYPTGMTAGRFDPGGRIVVLRDTNDDGHFDTSTVFADNLPFPTGVLPWRNGVLICAAPDILYAEDTTGDGKADVVKKLYSGFGTHNYHGRVNSLQYGLDGWVYGSCGLFGGNIKCHVTGKTVALGDRDFRIKPDTGELEAATGRTQQGRVRDDWGNWFGCDNSNVLWHYPLDDQYLRRNPHVAAPRSVVNAAPGGKFFSPKSDAQRFELSGPPETVTAACGLGIYRDDLLGADFTGNAFTCEPVNLLVHRLQLTPKGTTFAGSRPKEEQTREFLASTDNWFRPVHAVSGPDGCLWIADMYRFLIEHPQWIPATEIAKIDVRAGAGLGRIYRVRPADKAPRKWPNLAALDTVGLVKALESPNGWERDMATQLLLWRNDKSAALPLQLLLTNRTPATAQLHALCVLDELDLLGPVVVRNALNASRNNWVSRHCLRLAEKYLDKSTELTELLVKCVVKDLDAPVQIQLAYSLGALRSPEAGRQLANLALLKDVDQGVIWAVVSSLNSGNIPEFTRIVMQADRPPEFLVPSLLATAAGLDNGKALPALLETVTKSDDGKFKPWQFAAVAGALTALERKLAWAKLPQELRDRIAPVIAAARTTVGASDSPPNAVLSAIPLLARDGAFADDVKRLAALLSPERAASVQVAALAALNRIGDRAAVPPALIKAWPEASPSLRSQIIDALYDREAWQPDLLAALEQGKIAPGQVEAPIRFRLVTHPDAATRARAEKLFGATDADRAKIIASYDNALSLIGDKVRGKAVFAKSCAACHALDGVGSAVGPDLAALANKSGRYLLGEILDPSRNLDSRYAEYVANTKDGRSVTGVLAGETATGITLRGKEGKEDTILRADLEKLRGSPKSLMPDGLEKDLPPQAMADLLAYLTTTDAPPKQLRGNTPAEIAPLRGLLTLPADRAYIYGGTITFEPEFRNVGYWHAVTDHVVWRVKLDKATTFDVYLDYACANDSAGNTLVLDGADAPLRYTVAGTGAWSDYTLVKLGTVKLPAGAGRLTVRPDAHPRGALLDLRTLYLVPVGAKPPAKAKDDPPLPKTAAEAAKAILDDATPGPRREALVKEWAPHAADVVRAMTADLPNDAKEEYRRIPWIWRVSIAAGRKNDAEVLRKLLDASLPKAGDPLRDWQAVVIGGGVINGIGLEGQWPGRRIAELTKSHPDLAKRWQEALKQSHVMAEDAKVPDGTRYDALRMIALDRYETASPVLLKHLAKGANAELQMGSVSGLVDVERADIAATLIKAMPDLAAGNRNLAVAGLLRTADRANALVDGVEKGTVKAEWLTKDNREGLLKHADEAVRKRAEQVLR